MIGHEMIGEWSNHLWQSTLFAVAAALVTLAFRKNRAQVRYWVWLSASVKFLIPFALLMDLGNSLWTVFAAKKIAAELAPPAVSLAMEQITQPFPQTSPFVPAASLPHTADWIVIAIFSAWLCGFLGVALARFRGWLRIRAAMSASTPIDIQAAVAVRSSLGLLEPGVVGVLRSVLLLPEGILERLSPSQLEAVIAHELSHVRRRDNLTAAIHMVVEAVFWFHPFVWWIGARLVEERECACDEAVLSLGGEPRDYADAIVSVCKLYVESPLACVSGISGADLKKRIVRIMARHVGLNMTLGKKLLLGAAALCVAAVPVVVGMANGRIVHAQSQPFVPWASLPSGGLMAPQILAQSTAASMPQFEVASIRPANPSAPRPGRMGSNIDTSPDRLSTRSATLKELIEVAYAVENYQVTGGPGWINSTRFEVQAKPAGTASRDQLLVMLRPLLADRFELAFHRETKELPVYALVVAKGAKLKGYQSAEAPHSVDRLGRDVTMTSFARYLTRYGSDMPVVDKTGLAGNYDLDLDMQKITAAAVADAGGTTPSIENMFQATVDAMGSLGLELVPTKAPVEILVIDHAEMPSVDGAEVPHASLKPVAMVQEKPVAESSRVPSQPQNTAAPSSSYEYEVATIKPSKGPAMPGGKIGLWVAPDGFSAWFVTPQQIISNAYGVKSFEISGGPSWVSSERFDIEAKMDPATADALEKLSKDQRVLAQQQMLQALLADRFQLTVHRETKEGTIYTLVIAKGGPKRGGIGIGWG